MRTVLPPLMAGAAVAAFAGPALAGGFYLQEQSVRGAARAYSGEVSDTGVQSLWWNPAAIARSPRQAYMAAHAVLVDADVTDAGSTITYPGGLTAPVGGEPRAFKPIQDGVAPNFAIATPIGDRFAIGLSVAAPYNFTTKYRPTAWARYDALESRLTSADFQLTGAMQVTDWLDVGVGVNAEHADAKLGTASPNLSPLLPDGVTQLSGDGWDWGWTVGAQAHFERLTLGASYRASVDHKLKGDLFVGGLLGPLAAGNVQTSGMASFSTPWIATFGGRYEVIKGKLTLNGQVQRIGWGEFDAIRVQTPAGQQLLAQNYDDVTSGGAGLDFVLTDSVTLHTGVQYDPTPTPDDERTARVPDGDRWFYGAGATAKISDRLTLDVAAAYVAFSDSDVHHDTVFYDGTPAATTTRLRGEVQGKSYILSAGLTATF